MSSLGNELVQKVFLFFRVLSFSTGLLGLVACSSARIHSQVHVPSRYGLFDPVRPSRVSWGIGKFQWPLKWVQVTSFFGRRGREFHEGIDLRAPMGTPVYAAQSGVVLYAGAQIKGYGNLIVVRHPDRSATLYAHNSRILVVRGEAVKKGQEIALSGNTGHSTGPHVHFEIRRGLAAVDPLKLLPRPVHMASLK